MTFELEDVRVARACPADWEAMAGDDQVRHCNLCQLNVYNLSGLSREEAKELIESREGSRLCVRFFRRKDGTVITDECPAALRAIRRRFTLLATAVTGLLAAATSWFTYEVAEAKQLPTILTVLGSPKPPPPTTAYLGYLGMVCPPTVAPPQQSGQEQADSLSEPIGPGSPGEETGDSR